MAHKAYETMGEKVKLRVKNSEGKLEEKIGIFQLSERFDNDAEGDIKSALDFIEPLYNTNPAVEEFAKGKIPKERFHPRNPILSFHFGVGHLLLKYEGKENNSHVFGGELWYAQGMFINDGNPQIFDKYKSPLLNAGFEIH